MSSASPRAPRISSIRGRPTCLGGKGNVVYIEGILGNPVEAERGHGFDLALKDYPGIKLVARRPGGWSRTTTAPAIADILTAHPDIDAISVSNDDSAIAVVSDSVMLSAAAAAAAP